jgi:MFS superfamily sulfate permease-like transporter
VARKMAVLRNELHILNSSQEMFAVGLGNVFGCLTGAYPVAGSFSRSSLNLASGARTPLSKVTVITVILLALVRRALR